MNYKFYMMSLNRMYLYKFIFLKLLSSKLSGVIIFNSFGNSNNLNIRSCVGSVSASDFVS